MCNHVTADMVTDVITEPAHPVADLFTFPHVKADTGLHFIMKIASRYA